MVSPAKLKALQEKMAALGLKNQEIEESFVKSGGRGGQKVNKTSSCVYLKHLPTQITVKCQTTRSQSVNRFLALRLLAEKIEILKLGKAAPAIQEQEKLKKQKLKRAKRAKTKILKSQNLENE